MKTYFDAVVLADSTHPVTKSRLVTMELTYPRCIHSEFMTHRGFSRNAASSRAIPISKTIEAVQNHPFIPEFWGMNEPGMQSSMPATPEQQQLGTIEWHHAARQAVASAVKLNDLKFHKQLVNRILEPYTWITVIATAVDSMWENFFSLRCHKEAEPHMQKIAYLARDQFDQSKSTVLSDRLCLGACHLPLVGSHYGDTDLPALEDTITTELLLSIMDRSVGRCARVSYLTHDGKRDPEKDTELANKLKINRHASPFEHIAIVGNGNNWSSIRESCASLRGAKIYSIVSKYLSGSLRDFERRTYTQWIQYRKLITNEFCGKAPR